MSSAPLAKGGKDFVRFLAASMKLVIKPLKIAPVQSSEDHRWILEFIVHPMRFSHVRCTLLDKISNKSDFLNFTALSANILCTAKYPLYNLLFLSNT